MSKDFKIEWIPTLLEHLASDSNLDSEVIADIRSAQALLAKKSLKDQKKKEKKKKKSLKRKSDFKTLNHTVLARSLPSNVCLRAMKATLGSLADDYGLGELHYQNYNVMDNGTYCFNIGGMCPIHKREHDGGARLWQIKQHPKKDYSIIKCWKQDNRFMKTPPFALF